MPSEFERSASVALGAEGPDFEKALEHVLVQAGVPPMRAVEGPSTIPKNTAVMGLGQQAVMFPHSNPPHFY